MAGLLSAFTSRPKSTAAAAGNASNAHRFGGRKRHEAGARGELQHVLARRQGRHLEQSCLRGLELPCPEPLVEGRGLVPPVALDSPLKTRVHQLRFPADRRTSRESGTELKMSR